MVLLGGKDGWKSGSGGPSGGRHRVEICGTRVPAVGVEGMKKNGGSGIYEGSLV